MATMTGDVMPEKYFSIDVECVATGIRHDARSVALVAIVDKHEKVILKKKVKVTKPVVSYLTPLTGIRPGDLDAGEDLSKVIRDVKAILGSDAVIVGHGIKNDIKWMELKEGIDYDFAVDLGQFFKTYNPRYESYSYFSLRHETSVLLGKAIVEDYHDPCQDALDSIQLFKKYYTNPVLKAKDQQRLLRTRPSPSWAKRNNYRWEGVCMASYMPAKCFCGAPTMRTD